MRTILTSLIVLAAMTSAAMAVDGAAARKLYEKVAPSLVAVQYTYDGELGRRELTGPGIVVSEDGLVIAPMALFPLQLPDAHLKEFKIIVPAALGKDEEDHELEATFVGRDERYEMAFLKAKEARKWSAIVFEDIASDVGDTVNSVGLLPKEAGYRPYFTESFVSANMRGPIPHVLVSPDGTAGVGSPVFNSKGKAIGIVASQAGQNVLLANVQNWAASINSPPRFFIPARDFLPAIQNPPAAGQPVALPWLGAGLTGLKKDVAEFFDLKGKTAAQVGEVIPNAPAAKAGLLTGDTILKMNGEALERGDEPDEVPAIMQRKLRRLKPGEKVTFTVLREKDKPTQNIVVTLEEQPRQPHQVARWMAEDLGFATREVVFADTYSKRLPADTKGATVAYVRENSAAATARLHNGDLITKLNNSPVTDLENFKTQYAEVRKANAKESVVLEVVRDRGTEVIRIEPPQ